MKLLGVENIGGRIQKWWLHSGDDAKDRITAETIQDVEPVFRHVKVLSDAQSPKSEFRYQGSIPATLIEELCRVSAQQWGIKYKDAFQELMLGKTDRAKQVWKMLLKGRDYRKLQRV